MKFSRFVFKSSITSRCFDMHESEAFKPRSHLAGFSPCVTSLSSHFDSTGSCFLLSCYIVYCLVEINFYDGFEKEFS